MTPSAAARTGGSRNGGASLPGPRSRRRRWCALCSIRTESSVRTWRAACPVAAFWLSAERDKVKTACAKNMFARAARGGRAVREKIKAPDDLDVQVEALLVRRCLDLLGLGRRAGQIAAGYEKVRARVADGDRRRGIAGLGRGGERPQQGAVVGENPSGDRSVHRSRVGKRRRPGIRRSRGHGHGTTGGPLHGGNAPPARFPRQRCGPVRENGTIARTDGDERHDRKRQEKAAGAVEARKAGAEQDRGNGTGSPELFTRPDRKP